MSNLGNKKFYYAIDGEYINKYIIEIDTEKLKEIYCDIRNECYLIANKKSQFIEKNRNYSKEELEQFDVTNLIYLISIIDTLLDSGKDFIRSIDIYDVIKKKMMFSDDKFKQFVLNDDYNDDFFKSNIELLKSSSYSFMKVYNEYFFMIMECINLELYDSILVEIAIKVNDFFGDCNLEKNVSSDFKRVLKLNDK